MYLKLCYVSCDDYKVYVNEILGFMELLSMPVIRSEGPQSGVTAAWALFSGCAVTSPAFSHRSVFLRSLYATWTIFRGLPFSFEGVA